MNLVTKRTKQPDRCAGELREDQKGEQRLMCQECRKRPYYITTAIAYASGKPHIGNTYEIILADAIARFKREEGYDVRFQTGTDEHGQKIEEKAKVAGVTPKEYVDRAAAEIRRIWDLMNTSYDRFIRTTDEEHKQQVQKIFRKLYEQGDIYKDCYEGMYCTPCESFWTPSQLVDGKCPDCGRPVQPAKEEAYFFRMSKYADRLIQHIEEHPEFIQPVSRKNEMMNNFLKPGLQDLCVSRTSFQWGIPVDFDPQHVVYVWLDALTNYLTGLGYDADGNHGELYRKYWPADLHLIGKDIIRFHTIYWPIFLMALGEPLPKQVFGHPWLLQAGGKMSKSRGNVLYADELAEFFGVDPVRYFCLHEMPFENDGVISWDLMVERYNSELANILGNLVSRTIAMSNKYFGGVVTKPERSFTAEEETLDAELRETVLSEAAKIREKMGSHRVADAISALWNIFKRCNKYIDETTPWSLAKDESRQERLNAVLYHLTEAISIGASLLFSFMPETSEKILKELNTERRSLEALDVFGLYPSGNKVAEQADILFARLDPKEVGKKLKAELAEREAAVGNGAEEGAVKASTEESKENAEIPAKAPVDYDVFEKCEFRVCEILKCEAVPKSKKLLCFQLRCGNKTIQILSGIKKWYPDPEKLVGKKVMAIVNLKPAKLAGMESQGMLLSAADEKDQLCLMTTMSDAMPSGAEIC